MRAVIERWHVEQSPGAVVIFDGTGKVADANAAACALLRVSLHDLLGRRAPLAGLVTLESPAGPTSVDPVAAALASKQASRGFLAVIAGTTWVVCDAEPRLAAGGDVESVALGLMDVTHLVTSNSVGVGRTGEEIVAELSDALAEARLDSDAILATAVSRLSARRRGNWVAVLLGKDPSTAKVVARNRLEPALAQFAEAYTRSGAGGLPPTLGISQRVAQTGTPLRYERASLETLLSFSTEEERSFIATNPVPIPVEAVDVLVVPMRAHGAAVGTLGHYATRASDALTAGDDGWLQEVADRLGVALENAQLYEDAVTRLDRLGSLASVGLALRTSSDLRLTLKLVLDQAVSSLRVHAADLLLLDDSDNTLTVIERVGFLATAPESRMPMSEGLAGPPAQGRRIETVTALSTFSQFRRRTLFAREGFVAYGAVPLIARDKFVGVLEVFHRSPLAPDQEWLSFLDALGTEAAIAIDSAAAHQLLQRTQSSVSPRTPSASVERLSRLEMDILRLLVEGNTNSEIGERVHLSPSTVKFHVRQILQKTGATNRVDLTHIATREGWVV